MINFQAIGVIRTPFKTPKEMPVQPRGATGVAGRIELEPALTSGLKDLDGFSHVIVLYHFHRAGAAELLVVPFLDNERRGLFATRAPVRPNPIGLSVLELHKIDGSTLTVGNVDMLDGTPLLDVKPYVPAFDQPSGEVRTGWFADRPGSVCRARSDTRFTSDG